MAIDAVRRGGAADIHRQRNHARASLEGLGTAGMEGTTRRRILGIGRIAAQDDALAPALDVGLGNRLDQRLGIGMGGAPV